MGNPGLSENKVGEAPLRNGDRPIFSVSFVIGYGACGKEHEKGIECDEPAG